MKRGERGKKDSVSEEKTKSNAGEEEGKGRNAAKWVEEEVCVSCEWDAMLAKKKKSKFKWILTSLRVWGVFVRLEITSTSGERRLIICTDKWKSEQQVRVCRGPRR